jgi:hypothetical protein
MCDYSLHNVASRPARTGDKLLTTGFINTETRGFAAVGEPSVAVCLLPGTELAFEEDVHQERLFSIFRRKQHLGKLARFRQINAAYLNAHHDALEFPNGKTVLLTELRKGQKATVLQLPAASQEAPHQHVPLEPAWRETTRFREVDPVQRLNVIRE